MMFFAGVDGGNSKTAALVADGDGRVLGAARGGASDIHAQGPDCALAEADRVLGAALRAANVPRSALASAAFSMAGADWPEDFVLIGGFFRRRLGAGVRTVVVNDAIGALRAGSDGGAGVAVVCGTWNAIGARAPDGRVFHLSAWPDSPGGEELARRALKAVFRDHLRLGPPTELTPAILRRLGQPNPEALHHALHRRGSAITREDVRSLAPLVLDVAEAGDALAQHMVREFGEILAAQARVAARRLGLALEALEVFANGGLFAHRSTALFEALEANLPGARVIRSEAPPVLGALMLAYDQMALRPDRNAVAESARWTIEHHQVRLAPVSPLAPRQLARRGRRALLDLLDQAAVLRRRPPQAETVCGAGEVQLADAAGPRSARRAAAGRQASSTIEASPARAERAEAG